MSVVALNLTVQGGNLYGHVKVLPEAEWCLSRWRRWRNKKSTLTVLSVANIGTLYLQDVF